MVYRKMGFEVQTYEGVDCNDIVSYHLSQVDKSVHPMFLQLLRNTALDVMEKIDVIKNNLVVNALRQKLTQSQQTIHVYALLLRLLMSNRVRLDTLLDDLIVMIAEFWENEVREWSPDSASWDSIDDVDHFHLYKKEEFILKFTNKETIQKLLRFEKVLNEVDKERKYFGGRIIYVSRDKRFIIRHAKGSTMEHCHNLLISDNIRSSDKMTLSYGLLKGALTLLQCLQSLQTRKWIIGSINSHTLLFDRDTGILSVIDYDSMSTYRAFQNSIHEIKTNVPPEMMFCALRRLPNSYPYPGKERTFLQKFNVWDFEDKKVVHKMLTRQPRTPSEELIESELSKENYPIGDYRTCWKPGPWTKEDVKNVFSEGNLETVDLYSLAFVLNLTLPFEYLEIYDLFYNLIAYMTSWNYKDRMSTKVLIQKWKEYIALNTLHAAKKRYQKLKVERKYDQVQQYQKDDYQKSTKQQLQHVLQLFTKEKDSYTKTNPRRRKAFEKRISIIQQKLKKF